MMIMSLLHDSMCVMILRVSNNLYIHVRDVTKAHTPMSTYYLITSIETCNHLYSLIVKNSCIKPYYFPIKKCKQYSTHLSTIIGG